MQALQYIIIGDPQDPSFTFEGDDILSTSGDLSVDMVGAELCTDVMEAEVAYDDIDGTLRALPWATPVYFYRGGNLEGKLYSVNVTRTGKQKYRLRTTSAAGIMEYDTFYGGMYNGQALKEVVEAIIGSNGLQPYTGIYTNFYRTRGGYISGFGMGSYSNMSKTHESTIGAFLSATMSSKLLAKLQILGFTSYDVIGLAYQCIILGAVANKNDTSRAAQYQYGLYMYMTRESYNVPYPAFGEVFFVYGQTAISLGTPASADEAVYEISVDPGAGEAVINGVTYQIVLDPNTANDPAAIHIYGGGTLISTYFDDIRQQTVVHGCELNISYYTIQDSTGKLQADYYGVRNRILGTIDIYDNVTYKRYQNADLSLVLSSDFEPYNGSPFFYSGNNGFQEDVLNSISFSDGTGDIPIYGWLPICTKREALQQLIFSTGVILIKDGSGSIMFTVPSTQPVNNIDPDSIYDAGSEEQPDHINSVALTEHAYMLNASSEAEIIYENTTSSLSGGYYIAEFINAPAMQESSSGIECLLSNCNAAVVIGSGTLTGHPYFHSGKVLQRMIASFPDGRSANVSSSTLVTVLNSESVLDRLQAYYSGAKKTRVDIAMAEERCGLMYSLTSAWGEFFSGYLVRVNKVVTSIVRAACEFIRGYTPPQIGNSYTSYVILTGNGTWTVPASVLEKETPRIHVVLIGGGRGGDGGFAGEDGMQPEMGEGSDPAVGGAAGDSGIGGKIFEITITNPAASYDYICGQGGAGGNTSYSHTVNNPGIDGNDTTVTGGGQIYSSASGESNEIGYFNTFTGERYAGSMFRSRNPDAALKSDGGNGGYDSSEPWGSSPHDGAECNDLILDEFLRSWSGGSNGTEYRSDGWVYARGGGGGGAGYGENGANGSNAYFANNAYYSGDGGNGGNATRTPPKATDYYPRFYGYGGLGGGGGGGGGAGGWVLNGQGKTYVVGTGGAGGYGGRGGDGGDGCVLIYY